MTRDGYTRLAKVCKETITAWLLGRKRKAVDSHGADAKKPRTDGAGHGRAGPSGGNAAGKGGQGGRGKKADAGRAGPAQKGRK